MDNQDPVEVEWKKGLILQFIELYGKNEVLWNINHRHYKVISKRTQAWEDISNELSVPVQELKKKISSLLASYRKVRQRCPVPSNTDEADKPTWFAYDSFYFLHDQYKPKSSIYSAEPEEEHEEIDQKLNFVQCEYNDQVARDYINEDEQPDTNTVEDGSHQSAPVYRTQNKRKRTKRCRCDSGEEKIYEKDQFDAYGDYIAKKLRTMDLRTCAFVQKSFSDILFDVDMENIPLLDRIGEKTQFS